MCFWQDDNTINYILNDVRLKPFKPLFISLTYVFGMGIARSAYICNVFGLSNKYRTLYLNSYIWDCIFLLIKQSYITGHILYDFIRQRIVHLFEIGLIRAKRIFEGQPARGQRTQSNARTPERLKPAPIFMVSSKKNVSKKNVSKKRK